MNKERFSGIELLKIFAIILIVMSHAIPFSSTGILPDGTIVDYMLNLDIATTNVQVFICNLIRYGGQLGNAIFVVCSAWFLIDSKSNKFEKIFQLVLDTFIISIGILLVYLALGYQFDSTTIIKQFLPVTMKNNWYVTCYLLFYLIHPFLNIIIKNLSKKDLFLLDIGLFFIYSIIGSIFLESFFYTQLIGFIELYFIVAYVKLYLTELGNNNRKNIVILLVCSIFYILLILFTNLLGLHIGILHDKMLHWCYFYNPFMILISISLFNVFKNLKIKSKIINFLSSLSLFVYIIHTNYLYVHYTFLQTYSCIYESFSFKYILPIVLIYGVVLLIISSFLSITYSFLKQWITSTKLYKRTLIKIENAFSYILNKIYLIIK